MRRARRRQEIVAAQEATGESPHTERRDQEWIDRQRRLQEGRSVATMAHDRQGQLFHRVDGLRRGSSKRYPANVS